MGNGFLFPDGMGVIRTEKPKVSTKEIRKAADEIAAFYNSRDYLSGDDTKALLRIEERLRDAIRIQRPAHFIPEDEI